MNPAIMKSATLRKKRILHLISGDLWAGAEVMALNLIRSLSGCSDLETMVILLNEGRLAEELRECGLAVHVIDERRHCFLEIFRKALAIVGDNPPDIVHAHRYKENLLALLISKSCRGIRLIATQHGLPEITGANTSLATRVKSKANFHILSRYFSKTVAVSDDIRSALTSLFGFDDQGVEVIHNGIELPSAPSVVNEDAGAFVIGSSGRLFPVKDYPLMVRIAQMIANTDHADIRFELAGDGPGLAALEDLVQRYGLGDRFIFRGHQHDMASFYRGLSIYLNTSIHEGIPMAILEAMAYGLPVVAPAVGGIGEIFEDGSEGFLIASRAPQDFAVKCLQLHEDAALWKRLSLAARKKAEQAFSAEKMAQSYRRLYLQSNGNGKQMR